MLNDIKLNGFIRNIQHSHTMNDVEYSKADFVTKRKDGKEDVLDLRFKTTSFPYKENDEMFIDGNIRSYSTRLGEGKNKVEIYVFTYFNNPSAVFEENDNPNNCAKLDGTICKIEPIRELSNGKKNIHFILANNLVVNNHNGRMNNYIPCIAWGKIARDASQLSVNDNVLVKGELHSREYKKKINDNEFEIRVAHELLVTEIQKL